MLYTSLIRSKIDYGCQVYNSASKAQLRKLDTIQATALRIATGAYKGTSNDSINVECNMLPLSLWREEMQLKYCTRSSPQGDRLPINEYTKQQSLYETQEGRLQGKIPYALNIQKILREHELEDVKIQEITYPQKLNLKCIKPRSTLNNIINKNLTLRKR